MMQQRGGTLVGFVVGVLVGLGSALAVAVYVTKVPVPFLNKGESRTVDQDAAESKKNKDWDPNAPLYGKNPAKPTLPAASEPLASASGAATPTPPTTPAPTPGVPAGPPAKVEVKPAGRTVCGALLTESWGLPVEKEREGGEEGKRKRKLEDGYALQTGGEGAKAHEPGDYGFVGIYANSVCIACA